MSAPPLLPASSATAAPLSATVPRRAGAVQAFVLIACNLMPVMGIIALAPVLPLLLKHFDATPNAAYLVPIALTVPAICIALLSGPFGVMADRYGRHRLMVIALLLYAFFGVMPMWLDTLPAIIASRVCIGVTEAMIITLVTTLTGDYFAGERRKKWIGLSAAIGSVLASGLFGVAGALGQISWRGPFAMYFLGIPIAGMVAWLLWEPAPDAESPLRSARMQARGAAVGAGVAGVGAAPPPFPWKSTWAVYAFTLPVAMLFFVGPIHLGRVVNEIGVTEPARIGMATGLVHLGVPVGAILFRYISAWPLWRLLGLAVACVGLPLLALQSAHEFSQVVALMVVSQFGCGLMLPSAMGWCLSKLPFASRGRGSGFFNSTLFVGQFITPLSFSWLYKTTGSALAAMFAFGVLGAVTLLAVLIARMQWGTAESSPPMLAEGGAPMPMSSSSPTATSPLSPEAST